MDHDETHSNTPSEPFHTIPIYQPDASSSDSDSNDNNESPVNLDSPVEENRENVLQRSTTITSVLQHRPRIQPPPRSFTEPVPKHERHPSDGDESSSSSYKKSKHELSKENLEKTHRKSSDQSKRDSKSYDNSMRGIKKEMSSVAIDDGGGLSFSSNYAYLSPPFGRIISSEIVDGKNYVSNLVGLVILPCLFLILYLSIVTIWTYIDLKNKGFDSSFTVAYYSPLMLFSIFYGEKKRVDVSKFHEVNYGAKWWRFGTSKVREGIIMSIYCIFVIGFVTSDIISRALNESNLQVSKVFEDFVPFLFMLIIFSSGFFIFIWTVVDPVIDGTLHGSGEGKKRLIGVLPNAFKSKRV
ncbi:11427_t:CDS:2 [Entrophospora sp. SA101]|nr:11427_t:CDS:2 [Entrophospora sp. SA101]CAJ0849443.1 19164_t:CDS:2 [Entrophospora sp. SA101]